MVLIAALIAVIYFKPGVKKPAEYPHLTRMTAADVDHIHIRQSGGVEIDMIKKNGVWMIDSPIDAYANDFRIEPLLGITEAASYSSFDAQGQDLAQFKLGPPLAALRLNDIEMDFGGTEPINNRRYVKLGDRIHLIDDHYYFRLQSDLPAFVSNHLLPPGSRPVKFTLSDFVLSRDAAGHWKASPDKGASPDAINNFVDEWKNAQAIEMDRYEGNAGRGVIRVEFEGGEKAIEFRVVESQSDVILARADLGLRYHLATDQGRRLLALAQPGDAHTP